MGRGMSWLWVCLLVCASSLVCASAETGVPSPAAPSFTIEGRVELPPPASLVAADFPLTLREGGGDATLRAFVTRDGEFSFLNVPEGTHILSVLNGEWIFAGIRLEVSPTGGVRAFFKDSGQPVLEYPFVLRPMAKPEYYVAKSGGQLLGMLRSPYVLLMLVGALFAFGSPILMEWSMSTMTEEEREELKKQMKKGGLMGVMAAGDKINKAGEEGRERIAREASAAGASSASGEASSSSGGGGGGGGAKRRKGKR